MRKATIPIIELSESDKERFWKNVRKQPGDGCWLWTGRKNPAGYGLFFVRPSVRFAHRLSCMMEFGEIPQGLVACHKCDVRNCVNPSHFFFGTNRENSYDRHLKGRNASGPEHGWKVSAGAARGDDHYSRRHPECLAHGDRNGSRTHPEKLARGEDNWQAILNPESVRMMRAERIDYKTTFKNLALKFGVTTQCARAAVLRHTWAHVV